MSTPIAGRDPRWPRDFRHRLTTQLLNPWQALQLLRSFPPRSERVGDGVAVAAPDPAALVAAPGAVAVTWLGHASALVQVDGVTALIDPVLAGGVLGARRLTPPGLTVDALSACSSLPIDVLLISHDHFDHLDAPTVRRLPRSTRVVVGAGGGPWFRRRGFTDVTELDWWESIDVHGTTIEFVPAHHWSRRGVFDTCRRLWGGWVLTGGDGRAVVHAGDTAYGPFLARIGARHRDVAVALLPVGAYAPRRLLRTAHMDPEEAVRAAADLGAARMVPIHWGTFVVSAEPVTEPIERTRAAWAAEGHDRAALWDLAIGETRTL